MPGWLNWKSHLTFDLEVVSSGPTLGIEITKTINKLKKQKTSLP